MADTLILDGGMSRELLRLGAELKQPEWSALAMIEAPAAVEEVHRAYLAAGAGGVAVGVHTTQFAIRETGLYEPVLRLAAPLSRRILEFRSPYRHFAEPYADPWGRVAAKWGDPSPDNT